MWLGVLFRELPRLHLLYHGIVGNIYLRGGYCHIAMLQRPVVGVLRLRLVIGVTAHHPVIVITTRMSAANGLVSPRPFGHSTHLHTTIFLHYGEIDVQANAKWQSLFQHTLGDISNDGSHQREVGIGVMVAQRERHRGDIFHASFKGNAHSARIMDIHRSVVSVVEGGV